LSRAFYQLVVLMLDECTQKSKLRLITQLRFCGFVSTAHLGPRLNLNLDFGQVFVSHLWKKNVNVSVSANTLMVFTLPM